MPTASLKVNVYRRGVVVQSLFKSVVAVLVGRVIAEQMNLSIPKGIGQAKCLDPDRPHRTGNLHPRFIDPLNRLQRPRKNGQVQGGVVCLERVKALRMALSGQEMPGLMARMLEK